MSSDEIIETLELQAKLLELHGANSFKVKAFQNASFRLNKMRYNFDGKSSGEITTIEGIGKGISSFIIDLISKGSVQEHDELLNKTPVGIIDIMQIKGLGPKKIRAIWQELGCETPMELLYACNENRLSTLKGFGSKTQQTVIENIQFMMANASKKHYAAVESQVENLLSFVREQYPGIQIEVCGDYRRKCEVLDKIEILTDMPIELSAMAKFIGIPIAIHQVASNEFIYHLFANTGSEDHLKQIELYKIDVREFTNEEELYKALQLPFIEPELREGLKEVDLARKGKLPKLIEYSDLKGILHNHTTYSDGTHTLKEMADYCVELGFQYLGICDHSRSAAYAGGLSMERVEEQQAEIDALNRNYNGFKILKGIESDILSNGSLDYPDEVLARFDFIVASVHSNLKMDEAKANERLIKAIENPYTSILGHPTGRLLLARPGYPVNHKKIIDACAANKVHIELNAHPYRLDIDWRWIYYCLEKGVKVSINPDAHHKEGFHDMKFGVYAARKGMLTKEMCLNALDLNELLKEFKK